MRWNWHMRLAVALVTAALLGATWSSVVWAAGLTGSVQAGGKALAGAAVSLWAASDAQPVELAQTVADKDGSFAFPDVPAEGSSTLYLIATGRSPTSGRAHADDRTITWLAVLGPRPLAHVVINEFTTVASAFTGAQFLDGQFLRGRAKALRIVAGNVHNFVDLATGGFGSAIADPLNSTQSPTLASFVTLANVLAGCATLVKPDACRLLFAAATAPDGKVPTTTLEAIEAIAQAPWHQPEKIFALLNAFYPLASAQHARRSTPFMPNLSFAPNAWVLPLRFAGGGLFGGGKLMFDSWGDAWIADNFQVGAQDQDHFWGGALSEFAPDGTPLSPPVTGFTGGGIMGPGFGLAIDSLSHVWVDSFGGHHTISVFDATGKPLSPPAGYDFGGRLGALQGIIATPSGDLIAADTTKSQLAVFPGGEPAKGRILCHNSTGNPLKNPCKLLLPFGLAVDQKNNIWVTNVLGHHVTRIAVSNPGAVETFKTGYSGSGIAVDSLGNVWITNRLGSSPRGWFKVKEMQLAGKFNYDNEPEPAVRITRLLVEAMEHQTPGWWNGGSITVLHPDGTLAHVSPIYGKGLAAPWAVSVDGNDNIWVSNFSSASAGIVELCGYRIKTCPPGLKTGDAISPPEGYLGGGLQLQVDIGIGPAGDVWVTNNWQDPASCFGRPVGSASTRCGGQGVVVFYGMAKPVRTPLIGPPQPP